MRNIVIQGTIHGKTVELDESPGLADGRRVEIVLRVKQLPGPPPNWSPNNGVTAAGMLADSWTDDDDRVLEEILALRKQSGRKAAE